MDYATLYRMYTMVSSYTLWAVQNSWFINGKKEGNFYEMYIHMRIYSIEFSENAEEHKNIHKNAK